MATLFSTLVFRASPITHTATTTTTSASYAPCLFLSGRQYKKEIRTLIKVFGRGVPE